MGTDEPAVALGEPPERGSSREVLGTDVATLLDLVLVVLEENAERESLDATDERPLGVDSAGALFVEERARALRMRCARFEEIAMDAANPLGLEAHDGEAIDTAVGAAAPADQALGVALGERPGIAVDLGVERGERAQLGSADLAVVIGRLHRPILPARDGPTDLGPAGRYRMGHSPRSGMRRHAAGKGDATMGRLEHKVALISGGARGLGRAMAEEFAREGARVVIGDVLIDEAEATAKAIGTNAVSLRLDVTSEADWADAVRATQARFGKLDVLVNNAGTAVGAPLVETTLESYRHVIEINQIGVFLGMRAAIVPMTEAGGGSIINISSIDGMVGSPRIISYIASKWAVRGMTKAAAMELAPRRIRVNSIHPGHVHTLLASDANTDRELVRRMIDEHTQRLAPMGRTGLPSEIAKLAAFLASDDSSYSTGSEFVADGGFIAGYPSPGAATPY